MTWIEYPNISNGVSMTPSLAPMRTGGAFSTVLRIFRKISLGGFTKHFPMKCENRSQVMDFGN